MIYGKDKLSEVDPILADLVRTVATLLPDIQVICGYRGKEEQDKAFAEGRSYIRWPNGKHNSKPSKAVDIAIVRKGVINWNNRTDFAVMGGAMLMAAKMKGVAIRWGGDFNRDLDFSNDGFVDSPHFELLP